MRDICRTTVGIFEVQEHYLGVSTDATILHDCLGLDPKRLSLQLHIPAQVIRRNVFGVIRSSLAEVQTYIQKNYPENTLE